MREVSFICPYCSSVLIEDSTKNFYCNRCKNYFKKERIACPVCYSPLVSYLYKYRFCSNWKCPSFFVFRRCTLQLDSFCTTCKRQVVDFGKVLVNYQHMCGLYNITSERWKLTIGNNRLLTSIDFKANSILSKVLEKYQNNFSCLESL